MLTSAQKRHNYSHAGFQRDEREELLFPIDLTEFLWNPVEAKGELLNLDDEVVREGGKAGGSDK